MTDGELELAERRAAVRALLHAPVLTTAAAESLLLVRRHATWLREFFSETFGWMLHVEREVARLCKFPADPLDLARAARPVEGGVFTKRRYVVLCLALAVLERSDRQTTLHAIASGVVALASSDPELATAGFEFALVGQDQRRELVAVIRALLDMGILGRVSGDEESFVDGAGDVLYRVERVVLSRLLQARWPPSTLTAMRDEERVAALIDEPRIDTEESTRREMRWRLARRLVEDPVVYYVDLPPEEHIYLQRMRTRILEPILEATGLVAEIRAEGVALVDPEQTLTDLPFPAEGTAGHVALLVAEYLAGHLRAGATTVSRADVAHEVAVLAKTHAKYWRKSAREDGAHVHLADHALGVLEALGLARCRGDEVQPLPAIARFASLPLTSSLELT